MAVTPDLAPGARARVWILLAVTTVAGLVTYGVFGRTEVLWIAAVVLAVLIYLLAGVALRHRFDHAALRPVLAEILPELTKRPEYWLLIDSGGTVLHMSPAGVENLRHSAEVLVGQRLADLVPMVDGSGRAALAELLRHSGVEGVEGRTCELTLLDEDGVPLHRRLRALPLPRTGRRARLLALGGEAA